MVKIKLVINKTLEENASTYFEKAKKAKKKMAGASETLNRYLRKLKELEKVEKKTIIEKIKRKKEWYEKFRWFISSEGFLCIGGRDATTNDIIIKKHTMPGDLVFHTDMAGSPFFIIKKDSQPKKEIGDATKEEAAQAAASYNSKAWRAGIGSLEVFYVKPEQLSKQAQSGEFLGKGSFMVRGKTIYLHPKLELAIGIKDGQIIGGSINAIITHASQYVIIVQGRDKASSVAKKIKSKFKVDIDLDDIIRFLPGGGCEIKK